MSELVFDQLVLPLVTVVPAVVDVASGVTLNAAKQLVSEEVPLERWDKAISRSPSSSTPRSAGSRCQPPWVRLTMVGVLWIGVSVARGQLCSRMSPAGG